MARFEARANNNQVYHKGLLPQENAERFHGLVSQKKYYVQFYEFCIDGAVTWVV